MHVLGILLASLVAAQAPATAVWATAVAKANAAGDVIILRYMSVTPPEPTQARFGTNATLTWKYEGDRGLPSATERQRMDAFEDLLQAGIEPDAAILVMVTTGGGTRQWVYYASSGEDFMRRMNSALEGKARFPVKIELAHDAAWNMYKAFRAKVARSGG